MESLSLSSTNRDQSYAVVLVIREDDLTAGFCGSRSPSLCGCCWILDGKKESRFFDLVAINLTKPKEKLKVESVKKKKEVDSYDCLLSFRSLNKFA